MLLRLLTIGLSNGAIIALNAIAVTVAYSVVRKINFAHGDMFALLSVLVTTLVTAAGLQAGTPLPVLLGTLLLILLLTAGAGALFGATIERVAFRPFRRNASIAPLIATIGISFMLYQAALGLRYLTNISIRGEHRSVPGVPELPRIRVPDLLPDVNLVRALGLPLRLTISLHDLFVLGLAVGLAFAVNHLMQHTSMGRVFRACTDDAEMAQLCGVSYNSAVRSAFALSGALAGVAACAFALYYGQPFTQYGAQSGLIAFMAAVLGGIGRPIGALLAALTLGVVAAFSDYFLAAQWTPVLLMSILMVLLFLRPRGLRDEGSSDGVSQEVIGTLRNRLSRGQRIAFVMLFALGLIYPLIDQLFVWRQLFVVTGILIAVLLACPSSLRSTCATLIFSGLGSRYI
jgi:branched-subunit amino acid ABC-type transport system permease component